MELGTFGVFSYLDPLSAGEVGALARKLEHLGYSALWFPETFGRDPFVCAAHVLGNTERLIAGAAVAVVWKREAPAMAGAARTPGEMIPVGVNPGVGRSGGPLLEQHRMKQEKPPSHKREDPFR